MALALAILAQATFTAHDEPITDLAWSPDGTMIATSSMDLSVKVWDAATGKELSRLPAGERNPDNGALHKQFYVRGLRFFPASKRLATFGWTARIWNLETREEVVLENPFSADSRLAISPDGALVATGGWGIRIWDGRTGAFLRSLNLGETVAIEGLEFSRDGRRLVTRGWKNNDLVNRAYLKVWSLSSDDPPIDLGREKHRVDHAALSPDGKTLLAAYQHHDRASSSVVAWDLATGAARRVYGFDVYTVDEMRFSPDGGSFATLTWGDVLRLFDLGKDAADPVHELKLPGTIGLSYAPDGRTLAVLGREELKGESWAFLSTREVRGGREISDVRLGTRPLGGIWSSLKAATIVYSPDGRRMAIALANREVVIR